MKRDEAAFEEKRSRLRAAFAQIATAGRIEDATWTAVSRQAGFSPKVLVYYFGNLPELLWSIVSHHIEYMLERLGTVLSGSPPPDLCLSALAQTYVAVTQEFGAEHRITLEHNERLAPKRSRDARQMQRWVLDLFAEAVRATLPPQDHGRAMPLSLSLLAMLDGQARWLRDGRTMSRQDYVDMAVRMVLSEVSQYRQAARRPGARRMRRAKEGPDAE